MISARPSILFIFVMALLVTRIAAADENLILNSSFEEGEGNHPAHWSVSDPGAHARAEWATEGHTGKRSIAESVDDGESSVWWRSDLISVKPNGTYTLSVWYRCANPNGGWPTPQIQAADGTNLIDWNIPVRTSWSQFTQSFKLGQNNAQVRVCLINYHRAGQKVYWDDVRLVESPEAAGGMESREVAIAPEDPNQTTVAARPYELGNRRPDFEPSILFSDLSGWKLRVPPGMEATAAVSAQQRIRRTELGSRGERCPDLYTEKWKSGRCPDLYTEKWKSGRCLRVNYHRTAAGDEIVSTSGTLVQSQSIGTLEFTPPHPIEIKKPFDAVQLWVNGDNYYSAHQPHVIVRLLDADGKTTDVDLGPVNWMYWFLMYAPAPRLKPPVRFSQLLLTNITNTQPLDIYFDALAFMQAPRQPLKYRQWDKPLPFPARPETILPTVRQPVRNTVRKEGDAFIFECATAEGPVTYRYEPKTGTLSDVSAMTPGEETWKPLSGGGPVVTGKGPIGSDGVAARLVSAAILGDAVLSTWRITGGAQPFTLIYSLRARGKSFIIDVRADKPEVSSFSAGRIVGGRNPKVFWVSHANCTEFPQPHVFITDNHFASIYFDWYVTESSAFYGAGEVSASGAQIFDRADYLPKMDGTRNLLRERLFLTISNHFDEVLPNVPNPPSPLRDILRTNLYITRQHYGGGAADYDSEFAFWKHLKAYGVNHLTIRLHADFWRDRESFTLKDQATPAKGGDPVAKKYIANLQSLGYRVGLYTNYMLISPLSEAWDPNVVDLLPDGDRREQAYATNVVKPSRAAELEYEWAPRVHAKFKTSASYCDQHTVMPPSENIDFDPRVPGAVKQRDVFENYGRLLHNERIAHHGPCYSEGGFHAIYAGLTDGSYGQTRQPDAPAVPDFTLLKIHPLEADVGYDLAWLNENLDRLLAMQIVYGHVGMFWRAAYSGHVPQINVPEVLRSYFMMQQLQYRYTMEPVESIRYFDGTKLIDTDEALHTGAYRRSQVVTKYRNGLVVAVNSNNDHNWNFTLGHREFILPPFGWVACDDKGFLEYSALFDGKRRDFISSSDYVYFDGRGNAGSEGCIASFGQVIVLRHPKFLRVISVDPKTPVRLHLPTLGVQRARDVFLTYLVESGETVSSAKQPWPTDGWFEVKLPERAFAVQVSL